MSPAISIDHAAERRTQILDAALLCFSGKGFHNSTMHDISSQAGISVGLIYRYFENKDAVIAAMADEHKREIGEVLARSRQAPTLREALEILFTCHCQGDRSRATAAFVLDLFAEASRNQHIANLVREVMEVSTSGLTELIADSKEILTAPKPVNPRRAAEMILAVNQGMMIRAAILESSDPSAGHASRDRSSNTSIQAAQLQAVREILEVLFEA